MPTKPKTRTTTTANRRKNNAKRKRKAWMWWITFLVPIIITVWLFAGPVFDEAKTVFSPSTSVEEIRTPSKNMNAPSKMRSRPPQEQSTQPKSKPIVTESVRDDVDWALGHMYKLFPLILSLIALFKRDKLLGRQS
jgi:hypothetical protein